MHQSVALAYSEQTMKKIGSFPPACSPESLAKCKDSSAEHRLQDRCMRCLSSWCLRKGGVSHKRRECLKNFGIKDGCIVRQLCCACLTVATSSGSSGSPLSSNLVTALS